MQLKNKAMKTLIEKIEALPARKDFGDEQSFKNQVLEIIKQLKKKLRNKKNLIVEE